MKTHICTALSSMLSIYYSLSMIYYIVSAAKLLFWTLYKMLCSFYCSVSEFSCGSDTEFEVDWREFSCSFGCTRLLDWDGESRSV